MYWDTKSSISANPREVLSIEWEMGNRHSVEDLKNKGKVSDGACSPPSIMHKLIMVRCKPDFVDYITWLNHVVLPNYCLQQDPNMFDWVQVITDGEQVVYNHVSACARQRFVSREIRIIINWRCWPLVLLFRRTSMHASFVTIMVVGCVFVERIIVWKASQGEKWDPV
jgi:hypothetical protein